MMITSRAAGLFTILCYLGIVSHIHAATLPTLPLSQVDVSMPTITGQTFTVNAGGNLQAAIDAAVASAPNLNHEVVIQAGATFNGTYTLPGRGAGTGWIILRSSSLGALPAGVRVSPANASNMPKLVCNTNGQPTLRAVSNAHHYRIAGLEITHANGVFVYDLTTTGEGIGNGVSGTHHIIYDRNYIHGTTTGTARRGIRMDATGGHTAAIENYINEIHETLTDSQAVLLIENTGPALVRNNYLEAGGENMMIGGAQPAAAQYVPADVTVVRNTFANNPAWRGTTTWTIKCNFELKLGKRVLVEGNIMEYNWPGDIGYAWRITPRNESGGAPFSEVSDITFRHNITRHVAKGFNFMGSDDQAISSEQLKRILIENNLWYDMGGPWTGNGAGEMFMIWVNGGPYKPLDVTMRHNTIISSATGQFHYMTDNAHFATNFEFKDNIMRMGNYGVYKDGGLFGKAALDANFTAGTYTWTNNVGIDLNATGSPSSSYPPGNHWPSNLAAVGFVDLATNNYRLAPGSPYKNMASDGKDIGVDMDALLAAQNRIDTDPPRVPQGPAIQ